MDFVTRTPLRVRHHVKLRLARVARAETLSPRVRRIVLTGDELSDFATESPDDHVKLFFPAPAQERPLLPALGSSGLVYPEGVLRPDVRDYTPRRFDPQTRELTIEFVLHGDGPASHWAARAQPGQWVGVGGPRSSLLIPDDYAAYLLVGDESALPAIGRFLEEMRPGQRARALIEVANPDEQRFLSSAGDVAITWLPRNGAPAGRSNVLMEALRGLPLPERDTYGWLAGEIDSVRQWRQHLIDERGLPRSQIRAAGYWRLGSPGAHARLDD